ncbi:YajG family lipoprotein, partial [Acidithiobacillus caldus]
MTVHSHYTPPVNVAKVPGADKIVVDVIVKNEKKHKNEISVQNSAYGIPMAGLYMPVKKDFQEVITKALVARGFHVSDSGNKKLYVIIKKFFLVAHPGMFSTSHTGELTLIARVFSASQKIYNCNIRIDNYKYVDGGFGFQLGYQSSANGLLNEGVSKLMSNKGFINAMKTQ